MNSVTIELEVNVADVETHIEDQPVLSIEQLSMIAGGQCTTNSI